jgi:hypothetical protein
MSGDYRWQFEQLWPAGSVLEEIAATFPAPAGCGWIDAEWHGRTLLHQRRPCYVKRRDDPKRFLVPLDDGRVAAVLVSVPPYYDGRLSSLAPDAVATALAGAAAEDAKAARAERARAGMWWNRD